jgi:hypothetical protein
MSKDTYNKAYHATLVAWLTSTDADRKPIRLVKTR